MISKADAAVQLARAWEERGRVGLAQQQYLRALELRPDYINARLRLARLFLDQGSFDETVDLLAAANPNCNEAQHLLREALFGQGGFQRALDYHGLRCLGGARPGNVPVITVIRNEAIRLPYFLRYYRELGATGFLMVDNGSTDGGSDWLLAQPDVQLWTTSASFNRGNFGSAWFSALTLGLGMQGWCLVVDADEFFCCPGLGRAGLFEFCSRQERAGYAAVEAPLLDMYSRRPLEACHYRAGQDPLEVCSYFDLPSAYQGGVRERIFGPEGSYLLTKVPLLRCSPELVFSSGQHGTNQRLAPTRGALLHFKYLATFEAQVSEQVARREHYGNAMQYRQYQKTLTPGLSFYSPQHSIRYRGPEQLQDLGITTDRVTAKAESAPLEGFPVPDENREPTGPPFPFA